MAYRISGRVITVGPTQTLAAKSGNSYTKRDLIMTVWKFDPYTGYPSDDKDNTPKFTFFGQQCQQLNGIKAGDIVVVHFDVSGRSYEKDGKTEYFTEVRPFRVESSGPPNSQPSPQPYIPQPPQPYQAPLTDSTSVPTRLSIQSHTNGITSVSCVSQRRATRNW